MLQVKYYTEILIHYLAFQGTPRSSTPPKWPVVPPIVGSTHALADRSGQVLHLGLGW
jgi:hypothetical protein